MSSANPTATLIIIDAIIVVVLCSLFPLLYATYSRTISFKIADVTNRITSGELQRKRLQSLAQLRYKGYLLPIVYCTIVSAAGVLVCLAKGGLVSCAAGRILGRLPAGVVAGFGGAYTLTVFDLIRRHRRMEMHADSMQRSWHRMLSSPIIAMALSSALNDAFAIPAAFGIGMLPFNEVFSYFTVQTRRKLGVVDAAVTPPAPDLTQLQGIDKELLERFQNEGLNTIQQLGLGDILSIFLSVNVEWKTLLDLIDQALLYCFVGEVAIPLRRRGIRGAIEVVELAARLRSSEPAERANGRAILQDLASLLGVPEASALNLVQTIAADGQALLVRSLWEDAFLDADRVAADTRRHTSSTRAVEAAAPAVNVEIAGRAEVPVMIPSTPRADEARAGSTETAGAVMPSRE
jgi:hypothetical protein